MDDPTAVNQKRGHGAKRGLELIVFKQVGEVRGWRLPMFRGFKRMGTVDRLGPLRPLALRCTFYRYNIRQQTPPNPFHRGSSALDKPKPTYPRRKKLAHHSDRRRYNTPTDARENEETQLQSPQRVLPLQCYRPIR